MKPTKRKAFSFLRSYFDVLNKLENDKDKLQFLLAVINKQFLDEDPKGLNIITDLAYESQRHAIEKSVDGYKSKTKDPMQDPTKDPCQGGTQDPCQQEEEKEEEQEEEKGEQAHVKNPKKDLSTVNKKLTKKEAEKAFIEWFNIRRSKALKLKSNLKALSETDKRNFHRLKDEYNYNSDDFNKAFNGMLKNGWAKETNNITPKHFLVNDNFNKYYLMGSDESQKKPLTLSEITRNQYHG